MSGLLIIEDDRALGAVLERLLSSRLPGVPVQRVESVADARKRIARDEPAVILTDLRLGDGTGIDVLKSSAGLSPKPAVILLTGNATLETAIEALRLGAFDYLLKPYEEEHLVHAIRRALESRRLSERVRDLAGLTSEDPAGRSAVDPVREDALTKKLFADAARLAAGGACVLLTGESGTGKEVVARFIHSKSPASAGAFVAINCAAIPETLLEAELFGYEKGAFTGASSARKGKFELADGGTLLLDEIGELPLALQPKLLRVLDGHGFLRLGGQATVTSAARIIAATNRNIDQEVSAGRFREDLFYRLNVARLDIPPLRERRADILPLAKQCLARLARTYRRAVPALGSKQSRALTEYPWPGNVRELQNVLERAVLLSPPGRLDLPPLSASIPPVDLPEGSGRTLAEILDDVERRLVRKAMADHDRNKSSAARALGLSKQLFSYKLKKYGLD